MQLLPKDIYEDLEFDKVLDLLEQQCRSVIGREQVRALEIKTDFGRIQANLLEAEEARQSLTEDEEAFPFQQFEDIRKDLRFLEIVDSVLMEEALQRIHRILNVTQEILDYFEDFRQKKYPNLYRIIDDITLDPHLISAIDRVLDEEGNIKPDASPELLKIRKQVLSHQKELERQFRVLIQDYKNKGWLTDTVESFRNGRRVLSVPSEHKRKIRGIIHDESATGKTAYIEPDAIIGINNDIFDLFREEKREIHRILQRLSAELRPHGPLLGRYLNILIRYDVILAKARLAIVMDARMPKLKPEPHLGLIKAYHPLLLLKNNQLNRKTVPFDLQLFGKNRILMLSGPNAGGKSVSLKTVGLLQLMVQAGMLIPAHEETTMGIFQKLFTDIGDQQSLEDDLSTYSSRLKNMKDFLDHSDAHSLLLIDEFGSGTDPQIGGAIAEAILKKLNDQKVYGVITTHYSNLKIFAYKTGGIVNGSMQFNKDSFAPTYEMHIGRPGSSYAFEIAEKTGFDAKILRHAKKRTGKNEKAVDQLLVDLQREKQEVEEKLKRMIEKEGKLNKLIKNYDQMHKDLDVKRKKLKLEIKQQNLQEKDDENRQLEKLVRELKEEKNIEKAKKKAAEARRKRKELRQNVQQLSDEVYKPVTEDGKVVEIKEGDFVRLRTGKASGKVKSIKKGKAIIQMGMLEMTAKVRDLIPAKEPLKVRKKKGIQTNIVENNVQFDSKIDLRGLRMEESIKVLESYIDQAILTGTSHLRIVHGKGNGILRKAVLKKLREYKEIQSVSHPPNEQGGDGVTLVEI